jgi:uncharacterized membrane protein YdjX (TVP38/TMEM64 family)
MTGRVRIALLVVLLVALALAGWASGDTFSAESVRRHAEQAGLAGVAAFVALFVIGELLQVPGLVFVGVAVAVWGPARGAAIVGAGALLSVATSFVVVRGVGGQPIGPSTGEPAPSERLGGLARRLLARLEERPVATIAALRALLILSPPVTYALALSPVRFRDYMLGSALGLVPPLAIAVVVFARLAG